jgi:hypothetical protein
LLLLAQILPLLLQALGHLAAKQQSFLKDGGGFSRNQI